jgi:hypothetical protein
VPSSEFQPAALAEYREWHHQQVTTGDIDPVYPFLRAYNAVRGLGPEQRASLVLSYAAVYHIGSGLRAWEAAQHTLPEMADYGVRPVTGTERRGHRSREALANHLDSLAFATIAEGGWWRWLTGASSWDAMIQRAQAVHGNARWAAYKTAELAQKVLGAPYTATDAGHKHSSGPRLALRLLGVNDPGDNSPATISYLEAVTAELAEAIGEPDIAQVETSLCDWRSHRQGRHPVGHDVAMLAEQLEGLPGVEQAWRASGLCLIC